MVTQPAGEARCLAPLPPWLDGRVAAVDGQHRAGYVGGHIGGEKDRWADELGEAGER